MDDNPTKREMMLLKHILILVSKEPLDEYELIIEHYSKVLEQERFKNYKEKLSKYLKNIGDTWVN